MKTADTILVSFVKGVLLSAILLFLQTYFSSAASVRHYERKISMEVSSQIPQDNDQRSGETVLKQSGGPHASGHVFVNREILCLFEIIFSDSVNLNTSYISIPIPLVSLLRILSHSSISVNAP